MKKITTYVNFLNNKIKNLLNFNHVKKSYSNITNFSSKFMKYNVIDWSKTLSKLDNII